MFQQHKLIVKVDSIKASIIVDKIKLRDTC